MIELLAEANVLPTPLVRELRRCQHCEASSAGRQIVAMYEQWRRLMFGIVVPLYLRHGRAEPTINALLFPAAQDQRLPSSGISRLLARCHVTEALTGTESGDRLHAVLGAATGATGGTDLLRLLDQYANFVHHGLSSSAEDELRFRQLCELVSHSVPFFRHARIFGLAYGRTWCFTGAEPRVVEQSDAPGDAAEVWLADGHGNDLELSAFFFVAELESVPELSVVDQITLAKRLDPALSAAPSVAVLYSRYRSELRGEFPFAVPPRLEPPADARLLKELDELPLSLDSRQPCLVIRHLGCRAAASWITERLASQHHHCHYYCLAHSPVTLFPKAFLSWLWRRLYRHLAPERAETLPRSTEALVKGTAEAIAALKQRAARHVLLLDGLELAAGSDEFLRRVADLHQMGLPVVALAQPCRLGFAATWHSAYWPPAAFPELEKVVPEELVRCVEQLAPPFSFARSVLEIVAAAEEPTPLAQLTRALESSSPQVFSTALELAPLFLCRRGTRDLIEGFEDLQPFSPHIREIIHPQAASLSACRDALNRSRAMLEAEDRRRRMFLERTMPPSHEQL